MKRSDARAYATEDRTIDSFLSYGDLTICSGDDRV